MVCEPFLPAACAAAGEVMSYEALEAWELRGELELVHEQIVELAAKYRHAVDAEDEVWTPGLAVSLDAAIAQAKHIRGLLKVGAVT